MGEVWGRIKEPLRHPEGTLVPRDISNFEGDQLTQVAWEGGCTIMRFWFIRIFESYLSHERNFESFQIRAAVSQYFVQCWDKLGIVTDYGEVLYKVTELAGKVEQFRFSGRKDLSM